MSASPESPAVTRRPSSQAPVVVALSPTPCDDGIESLRDGLYDLLLDKNSHIILDAADVRSISAAGVGVLIAAALIAQKTGATLQIANPSSTVRHLLLRHQHMVEIIETGT